jgi:hypothetical protein
MSPPEDSQRKNDLNYLAENVTLADMLKMQIV